MAVPNEEIESQSISMSINVPAVKESNDESEDYDSLATDGQFVDICKDVLSELDVDRKQVDEVFEYFHNVLVNDGDATNSTKESLVGLLKVKNDIMDKKIKVMDAFMKIRLKSKEKAPVKFFTTQKNTINNGGSDRRKLLEQANSEG